MNSKDLRDLHESFSNIINEQVTSTTHDWKRGVDKAPAAPTLPPSPESRKRNQLPKRTAANAANVQYYKDDVDVFDLVKGHLMSEGYADTEEAALAIMSNMSEEWRQSIVEQARSREFEHGTTRSANTPSGNLSANRGGSKGGARSREFEHGTTRSMNTPSKNLGDGLPRDKKGNIMY